jgi:hypothetical protein
MRVEAFFALDLDTLDAKAAQAELARIGAKEGAA